MLAGLAPAFFLLLFNFSPENQTRAGGIVRRMAFDISDLPNPENRTPRQWYVFWLRLYESVAVQGKSVSVAGRMYTSHDLAEIAAEKEKAEAAMISATMSKAERFGPIYLG